MKVSVSDYSNTSKTKDLATVLQPHEHEGGQIERLERLVERQSEILGRIGSLLVESKLLALEEAAEFFGHYGMTIELEVKTFPSEARQKQTTESNPWKQSAPKKE